jgi:gliding motility-associated lipoprotein GldD
MNKNNKTLTGLMLSILRIPIAIGKESIVLVIIFFFLVTSCAEETLPKPKAFLRLAYGDVQYQKINTNCPYTFEFSSDAIVTPDTKCWLNITYPKLKASLNLTYRPIENNLKELLQESEKLTYNHAIKADGISALPFIDAKKNVYGSLSEVTGNAASPIQFHLTDSVQNFITGALYFKVQPNYDSILPAVKYIEKDIKHLMETLEWKNN